MNVGLMLILRMQWMGLPHSCVARAIALVGEKLLPALRRLGPGRATVRP